MFRDMGCCVVVRQVRPGMALLQHHDFGETLPGRLPVHGTVGEVGCLLPKYNCTNNVQPVLDILR